MTNTPFEYVNTGYDDDDDRFVDPLDHMIDTLYKLYRDDPYRVKEGIRDLYAIIRCRENLWNDSVNKAEFNELDQAMNFLYLVHHHQHYKMESALEKVSKSYPDVSRKKLLDAWNSIVAYKKNFGIKIGFQKKSYTRANKKRHLKVEK